MSRLYLKEPDVGVIGAVQAKQNVTLPFVYDSLDDSNFEPQFVRIRRPNTSTFYQGNIGNELAATGSTEIKLNGQSIFNGIKRLYMNNVVIREDNICTINGSNNTLKFGDTTRYTLTFKAACIKNKIDLIAYLNNPASYSIDPVPSPSIVIAATDASSETFNDDTIRIGLNQDGGPTEIWDFDYSSSFFNSPMWGAYPLSYDTSTDYIYLLPAYLPCNYWDFRSTQLNKYNKNFNRASNNTNTVLFRYYFSKIATNPQPLYSINWNKESITSFDLNVVDDAGNSLSVYSFLGRPFISLEINGEQ